MADDLAKTIASTRQDVALASRLNSDMLRINLDLLTRLLDAAEAGMRARDAALVMEEGLQVILNAPLPPHIGPAHQLQGIARRTLSRLVPVQGSSDVGFALSTPDVDVIRDAALEEAAAAVAAMKVTGNDKAGVMAFILVRDACVEHIRALKGAA